VKKYAEIEIDLRPVDETTYAVDFRFVDPDSETDQREAANAKFDLEKLNESIYDSAEYGKVLTKGLFSDPLLVNAFQNAAVRVGDSEDKKLRFRLSIGPGVTELHAIRWETLLNPLDQSSLCTNENILFSRYLSSYDWRAIRLRPKRSMRALVVVANPSDLSNYKMTPIKAEEELGRARKALGEIAVTTLPDNGGNQRATLENIMAQLREQEFDILYLVAHGALVNDRPRLWLETDDAKTSNTSGQELAVRIKELEQRPRLVVLASCESAGDGEGNALSALGPRLAEAGVPAVLAMQGKISMDTNADFMTVFFKELQRDGQIDRAVAVARGAVRERADFWMPALFMRLRNGRIWYEAGLSTEGKKFVKWPSLIEDIRSKKCTPILGSGLFEPIFGSSSDIAQAWADEFRYPMAAYDRDSLPRVAQYLTINQSPQFPLQRYQNFLRKKLGELYRNDLTNQQLDSSEEDAVDKMITAVASKWQERHPDDSYSVLAQLPAPIYITTNLSSLLVAALTEAKRPPEIVLAPWNPYTIQRIRQFEKTNKNYNPTVEHPLVYCLFGQLSEPDSVVLTEDDYFDYLIGISENNDKVPAYVRNAFTNTSLLFIGFRMDEWNFRVLFRSIVSKSTEMTKKISHIAAQIEPEEGRIIDPDGARGYLEKYFDKSANINLFWGTAEEFLKELWQEWKKAGAK